jgi:hypothetical protein
VKAVATYVTDLTHFLTDDGLLAPGRPGQVGGWFARVAAAASLHPCEETVMTALPCRRRPGRRPCPGYIDLIRHRDGAIEWACSDCDANGFISGWEGTRWDRRRAVARVPAAEAVDLLLSEHEFAQIRRIEDLGPQGEVLMDGAVRVGGGVRVRGSAEEFAELVRDLEVGARTCRGRRRQALAAIAQRMAAVVAPKAQRRPRLVGGDASGHR